jgi:hypothetical protein
MIMPYSMSVISAFAVCNNPQVIGMVKSALVGGRFTAHRRGRPGAHGWRDRLRRKSERLGLSDPDEGCRIEVQHQHATQPTGAKARCRRAYDRRESYLTRSRGFWPKAWRPRTSSRGCFTTCQTTSSAEHIKVPGSNVLTTSSRPTETRSPVRAWSGVPAPQNTAPPKRFGPCFRHRRRVSRSE